MNAEELKLMIAQGESEHLEFKRCGNQPEQDLFETICIPKCRFAVYLWWMAKG